MEKLNVLLVDDRPENLIALEALIKREDINIYATTSPNHALKLSWEKDIAIALVDVQMPEMDGFELVSYLKASPKTKDILVIFVTAISKETKYTLQGLNEGAIDYLYKPLDPDLTVAKVNTYLKLARYQRELSSKNKELENFSVVVNNSADIICTLQADTFEILAINPTIKTILGIEPDFCVGKELYKLTADGKESVTYESLKDLIADGTDFMVFEDSYITSSDKMVWLECRAVRKNDLLLLNMSDVTERKNYQKELIEAKEQALREKQSKEMFLANMSHEIRTPINGIMGLTNMLKDTNLDKHQKELIELISTSSNTLLGIVNDVLDISKIETGKFTINNTETNIRSLINSLIGLMQFKAKEKNIALESVISDEVPECILADGLRLNQILINLIGNAIKFTQQGYVKLGVSVIQTQNDNVQLQFTVEDTGIGIPKDKLESIFEYYTQGEDDTAHKFGGTGLGLSIVKNLVDLKGGKLDVQSEFGKGSIFSFKNWYRIAQKNIPTENADNEREVKFAPLNNIHILLAEDNRLNQMVMREMMKKWGVVLEIANNGKEALNLMDEKDFDLVLMDTQMPEMDGYETARNIRTNLIDGKKHVPIISISAGVMNNEQELAREAGMNDVLAKPIDACELYRKIKMLTGK